MTGTLKQAGIRETQYFVFFDFHSRKKIFLLLFRYYFHLLDVFRNEI